MTTKWELVSNDLNLSIPSTFPADTPPADIEKIIDAALVGFDSDRYVMCGYADEIHVHDEHDDGDDDIVVSYIITM